MPPPDETLLDDLVRKIGSGECILFLGAGTHVGPPLGSHFAYPESERPPLGRALSQSLASACRFSTRYPGEPTTELQRVALCFENTPGLGRDILVDQLCNWLEAGKRPSPALRMLAGLPFRIFITTNYDSLLEQALRDAGKTPSVLVFNPVIGSPAPFVRNDPTPERPIVFKMHGDFGQRSSIVITDEDYITFVQRMSEKEQTYPVPALIRFRMMQWPTLFVGYSLRDYNLRLLFRTLRWNLDPACFPQSYSVDLNPDPLILRVYQDERRFVTFLNQDIWSFVPWLHAQIGARPNNVSEMPGPRERLGSRNLA